MNVVRLERFYFIVGKSLPIEFPFSFDANFLLLQFHVYCRLGPTIDLYLFKWVQRFHKHNRQEGFFVRALAFVHSVRSIKTAQN